MATSTPKAERPAEEQDATSSARPVEKVLYGAISAAIFPREHTLPSGKVITNFRVSLERSYVDRDGKRQWTSSLDEDDLLAGSEALADAYKVIQRLRRQG